MAQTSTFAVARTAAFDAANAAWHAWHAVAPHFETDTAERHAAWVRWFRAKERAERFDAGAPWCGFRGDWTADRGRCDYDRGE